MIPAPCTNRLIRGGWCVGSQPAILVGAWIARSVAEWSVRTARIDRQSCMRSSHAPRTRNPEPRVRENRKTESRDFDSGTGCRKTPSRGAGPGYTPSICHPCPPTWGTKFSTRGRPTCGSLRITELYRINNKKCGLLHHQDSLESAESTAKIGLNSTQQRISEIQPLERSSHEAHACLASHRRWRP